MLAGAWAGEPKPFRNPNIIAAFWSLTVKMLDLVNPKQNQRGSEKNRRLYPYYAGYSREFVSRILQSGSFSRDITVLDPWNGSGTTTSVAFEHGYGAVGIDLNPAMVVIARAHHLSRGVKASLVPICTEIVEPRKAPHLNRSTCDPLRAWFNAGTVRRLRTLEANIQRVLIDETHHASIASRGITTYVSDVSVFSDLTAFFYVGLFRTVRVLLADFHSTNPTWVKVSDSNAECLSVGWGKLIAVFTKEIEKMADLRLSAPSTDHRCEVRCASSSATLLPNSYADVVITSPPYCTRIDYAVATRPELAVLGVANFDELRRELIGTPKVARQMPQVSAAWGQTCIDFLERVKAHPSKASGGYYLKNLAQYFDAMSRSIDEISRVCADQAVVVAVVQDSYYKDIHNDLPKILSEMFAERGFKLFQTADFCQRKSMAGINPKIRKYRTDTTIKESVICLRR